MQREKTLQSLLIFSGYLPPCEHAAAFCDSFDKTHISARPPAFYSKLRVWIIQVCGRKICMNTTPTAISSEHWTHDTFNIRCNTFSVCINICSPSYKSALWCVLCRTQHHLLHPDFKFFFFSLSMIKNPHCT